MTGKEHGNGWLWPSQVRPYITLHQGVESLLEQDSKPNRLVVPFTPISVNPSYWQQDGAKASGFKVSLLFGGCLKE